MRFIDRLRLLGFETYEAYLASPHWQQFKHKYKSAMSTKCRVCQIQPTELHHINYSNLGHESFNDIVPLCDTHHKGAHKWLKENGKDVSRTREYVTIQIIANNKCSGTDEAKRAELKRLLMAALPPRKAKPEKPKKPPKPLKPGQQRCITCGQLSKKDKVYCNRHEPKIVKAVEKANGKENTLKSRLKSTLVTRLSNGPLPMMTGIINPSKDKECFEKTKTAMRMLMRGSRNREYTFRAEL